MHTAVMTDTNSGISLEDGRALGIFVLPMPVIVDGQDYLEEVSITHEDLYKAIRKGSDVSSSQPSPGSLTEMWDRILSSGYDELVYIPMSSGLSSSCASALALAADYDGRVEVADNHRISVSLHDSVMDALSLAREGRTAREIREYLEETGAMSSIYITVNTLALLKKSGRVTPAAAAIATVMHLKPVLTIQGGSWIPFPKRAGSGTASGRCWMLWPMISGCGFPIILQRGSASERQAHLRIRRRRKHGFRPSAPPFRGIRPFTAVLPAALPVMSVSTPSVSVFPSCMKPRRMA